VNIHVDSLERVLFFLSFGFNEGSFLSTLLHPTKQRQKRKAGETSEKRFAF
jgi:hypothetical protein